MVAVIVDDLGPGTLGEDLHHDVLRVDEGLEIVEFWELIVRRRWVTIFFSRIEKLHAKDAKDKEEKCEKQKESSNNRKDLSKGLEKPPKLENKLIIPVPDSPAHDNRSQQKGHSKHTVDDEEVIDVAVVGCHEEKYDVEGY